MRRYGLLLALLLSVGVNCGLLGMAIARHHHWAAEREGRSTAHEGARLADRLRLEGDVRDRFLELQRTLVERVRRGRSQIDEGRRELRRELTAPAPDRARVEELLAALGKEQETLDRALVENVFAARELLDGPAEREYLLFVERLGAARAGTRPGDAAKSSPPRFRSRRLLPREGPR